MTTILNFRDHKPAVELSNEALIRKASSIGATMPASKTSNKYSFIPTIDAVNFLRDAGWMPIEARQGNPRKYEKMNFQQHMITFTQPNLDLGNRRLQMNLYNSHDAGSSYILSGGIYELVCSNGLVVGSNLAEYRHRHMNFNADLFIESARFVAGNMEKVAQRIENWETIELNPDEQNAFASAAHSIMFENNKHYTISSEKLLTPRRREDNVPSLWKTFNRIQENVIRGGLRGSAASGRRSLTRGVTNIKRDKVLNQSLWDMAEFIADIKQAA